MSFLETFYHSFCDYVENALSGVEEICLIKKNDHTFRAYLYEYTEAEFHALERVIKKNISMGNYSIQMKVEIIECILYDEAVGIVLYTTNSAEVKKDGTPFCFDMNPRYVYRSFILFEDRNLIRNDHTQKVKTPRLFSTGWPSTLTDLFECWFPLQRVMTEAILTSFAQESFIWKDLLNDFKNKSSYSAIPLSTVWESQNKAELMRNHYGISMKRFNKESLGKCIFLCKVSKLVAQNELQKLFPYELKKTVRFGKKPDAVYEILADFIIETCPECLTKPVPIGRGRTMNVTKKFIIDAMRMAHSFRMKIPLTFRSPTAIYEWHNEVSRRYEQKDLAPVRIPKDSAFKKLKMPDDCVRLKSKKAFVEEGNYQNNCVTSYIDSVNRDYCSIWSMRKPDGERYTIEICIRTSKHNPGGYYYIQQMYGFDNSDVPDEEYERVRECISRQKPGKRRVYSYNYDDDLW